MSYNSEFPKNWILIRGLLRSQFHWKNFSEILKTELGLDSVQAVELPGNGLLSHKETPVYIDEVIQNLRSQVKIKTSEPFGIIGISLGGMLATAWAQSYQNEVSHLVLINSSSKLNPFFDRLLPKNYLAILKNIFFMNSEKTEKFILAVTSNDKDKWQAHLQENIEFLKLHPIRVSNFIRQLRLAGQVDFTLIPKAKKLILTSKADKLVNLNCSKKIAKLWNCKIYYHEIAGHDLPLDDPFWVIEKIKNFN